MSRLRKEDPTSLARKLHKTGGAHSVVLTRNMLTAIGITDADLALGATVVVTKGKNKLTIKRVNNRDAIN